MDKTFRLILFVFAGLTLSLIGVVIFSITNLKRANRSAQWVNHTHALIAEVNQTIASSQRAEGALHSYLLTESPTHELLFQQAFASVAEHLEVAKSLAAADPDNDDQLRELEAALIVRAERARQLLSARRAGEVAALTAKLHEDSDDAETEATRIARRITSHHKNLLRSRDRIAFEQDIQARTTLYLGAALTLLMLFTSGWFIRDNLASRRREAVLLTESNNKLKDRVAKRTADLEESNNKLRAEHIETRWAAQALEHQLRYSNLIVESVANPVIVITKALNISRTNPAMEKITGLTSAVLVDHPLADHIRLLPLADEAQGGIDTLNWSLRHGNDLVDRAAEVISQKDLAKPVFISLFPLRDHDKVVGGVVVIRQRSNNS